MKTRPKNIYKDVDKLPRGNADNTITEGCLVLEGGAWKGLYTGGVVDCLMVNGINFRTTIGISAGALFGLGYVSGQIGWGPTIDLIYRHDKNYVGTGAMKRDHGVTGFSYLYKEIMEEYPMDTQRLMDTQRRFLVGATDMRTGKIRYFEKGSCNLLTAIRASATVPYVSRPVVIDGVPYLDGGCSEKIPYTWAKENGEKKIMVVKTREWAYRRKEGAPAMAKLMYRKYPEFVESIAQSGGKFNRMTEELQTESEAGRVFVMAPSEEVTVSRFEGDMQKLGDLYWLGYRDMESRLEELRNYLDRKGAAHTVINM